jgi:hypothetical protein
MKIRLTQPILAGAWDELGKNEPIYCERKVNVSLLRIF